MRDGRSDGGRGVRVQRTLVGVVAELMVHSHAHIQWQ